MSPRRRGRRADDHHLRRGYSEGLSVPLRALHTLAEQLSQDGPDVDLKARMAAALPGR
ncbi:MAG: hypothetical protein ACLQPH_11085 [Acidimicrobiales bacterium]